MFERFTDRARKIMALSNQEAQLLNHEYIGTEHILLGLIKEGSGVGSTALKNLDIDLRKVRLEVEKLVKKGPDVVIMGKLPQTPRAKKVIEFAIEESRNIGDNYVGTEHLLLGLLRERDGVAAQVLMNLGLRLEDIRKETARLLGKGEKTEVVDNIENACDTWAGWKKWFLQVFEVEVMDDDSGCGWYDSMSFNKACRNIAKCTIKGKVNKFEVFNSLLKRELGK